jgi:cytochrome c oxidase subunit 3
VREPVASYEGPPLPIGSKGRLSSGWWGMLAVIGTEAALFAYLFFSYFYVSSQVIGRWPPQGAPKLGIAVPETLILLLGSLAMWWGERGIRRGRSGTLIAGTAITLLLGILFLSLQGIEWSHKPFSPSSDVYASLYFLITGFHMGHVLIGLIMLLVLLVWTALGYFGDRRHSAVSIGVLYWHFVTFVWLGVFFTFYITPRLSQ